MTLRLIILFLAFAAIYSCQGQVVINHSNYKLFGRPGAVGLQDSDGNIVLDTVYMFLNFGNSIDPEDYYLTYKKIDGRRGMYVDTFDEPYFEVGEEVAYFDVINSMEFFAFGGGEKDQYGNYLEGVMTKEGEVIIPPLYKNILYYGGEYFYGASPEDKLYDLIDREGAIIPNRGRYTWVYGKHGVVFANKGTRAILPL